MFTEKYTQIVYAHDNNYGLELEPELSKAMFFTLIKSLIILCMLACLYSPSSHLGLIGAGAGWEVDEERQVFVLVKVVHQLLLHIHRLSCASGAHKQQGAEMSTTHTAHSGTHIHLISILQYMKNSSPLQVLYKVRTKRYIWTIPSNTSNAVIISEIYCWIIQQSRGCTVRDYLNAELKNLCHCTHDWYSTDWEHLLQSHIHTVK